MVDFLYKTFSMMVFFYVRIHCFYCLFCSRIFYLSRFMLFCGYTDNSIPRMVKLRSMDTRRVVLAKSLYERQNRYCFVAGDVFREHPPVTLHGCRDICCNYN